MTIFFRAFAIRGRRFNALTASAGDRETERSFLGRTEVSSRLPGFETEDRHGAELSEVLMSFLFLELFKYTELLVDINTNIQITEKNGCDATVSHCRYNRSTNLPSL